MRSKTITNGALALAIVTAGSLYCASVLAADPEENEVTRNLNAKQLDTPGVIYSAQPATAAPARAAIVSIRDMGGTSLQLVHRPVETSDGARIGEVVRVRADFDGRAAMLEVALESGRIVSLAAESASFDPESGVVIANMPASDVVNLPEI